MTDFGKFLDGARRAGRSIILSAENFDDPRMDIPFLAAALHGFETEVVVLHRPFFDWLRSYYTQICPPVSLEDFAADRILKGASGHDQSSVAVYIRYSQHFRNVTMRGLAAGYITRFVCIDVRAEKLCRHLQETPEARTNANKSLCRHDGCMTADQKELLWAVSAVMEARAQTLMATGEMAMNLTELRDRFAQAPYQIC